MNAFERWAPRLIVALVFFIPLWFSSMLYDTYDLPKLTLVYLCDLVLAVLWFWQALSRGQWVIRRTPLDGPLFIFLCVGLLSSIRSLDPSLSFFGAYRIYVFGWWPMVAFAALYFFTVQAAGESVGKSLRWAALLSAACVGFYGVLQYAGYEIFSEIPRAAGGRVWSSLGNPLYMGSVCMLAVPLALNRWSAGNFLCLALIVAGLLLSLSRSAWLGTCAAAICMAFFYRRQIRHWGARAAGAVVLIIGVLAAVPAMRARAQVLVSPTESSNASRLEGWKGGLRIWREHPILGSGPDTFFQAFRPHRTEAYIRATGTAVTQAHAHNDLIQMAATEGLFGLLAYVWILAVVFRKGLAGASDTKEVWGVSIVALLVQNQFNFSSVAACAWAAVFAGLLFGADDVVYPRMAAARSLRWAAAPVAVIGLWAILRPVRADWHFKQGLAWSQGGRYVLALDQEREAARLNGRVENYQSELANSARSAGYFDESWKASTDMVQRHPYNPDSWNNQGVAAMWMVQLAGQDKWGDAKTSFEKALTLDPVFVDAWANLAKWNHLRGNLDEEKRLWKRVLELDPRHSMARQVLGLA